MQTFHPLARDLNDTLHRDLSVASRLFSSRGREIYFPSTGILGQSAEAKGSSINATIGIALEDDGSPLRYRPFDGMISLAPKDMYPYAPSFGKQEFREAWQAQMLAKNPSLRSPVTLPVVAAGLTHSLSIAGYLFADPGDVILVTDQHWDNCELIFTVSYGATLRTFPTFTEAGFDCDAFAAALGAGEPGKRIVLLNFPNNPAGYTPTATEGKRIAEILRAEAERGSDIAVLLDDAYFGFVYEEDVMTQSLITLLADLHERVLVAKIDGPTKEDCVWGHRVGCISFAAKGMTPAAAKALEAKAAGAVRAMASNASHVSQSLLLALYASPEYPSERARIRDLLARRYRAAKTALADPRYRECFRVLPCNSGYFLCLKLADGIDAELVRRLLLKEFDTGVIAFSGLLRVAYSSLPEAQIPRCIDNIFRACQSVARSSRPSHDRPLAFA